MSIGIKHLAGFILGAAAGYAAAKYMNLSEEEKQAFRKKWKSRADRFRQEAEKGFEQADGWARDMTDRAAAGLKSFMNDAGQTMNEWFEKPGS